MQDTAVALRGVSKRFGQTQANDDVSLDIRRGEVLALLGENGSGKTTLMNMLAGIYYPDVGQIFVGGEAVSIRSPRDAFRLGIGMVHQHFKLVEVMTAVENILLGLDTRVPKREATKQIAQLAARYGFDFVPTRRVYDMSVSEKQTVEILKVLYRGAELLILDEPTAVLTPQETKKLFSVLRNMKEDGKSVVIITHKLGEVMEVSDRVSVLRRGAYIATIDTKQANPQLLAEQMVGKALKLDIARPLPKDTKTRLRAEQLSCRSSEGLPALQGVSFELRSGEILGVAGIAGSGQKELCEAIAGLCPIDSGTLCYFAPGEEEGAGESLRGKSARAIRNLGIGLAFVPEDRLGMGLVGSMGMVENMLLRSYDEGKSLFTDKRFSRRLAEEVKQKLGVSTPDIKTPVRRLSGGNVQKVLLGREIASEPSVLLAAYPVRGLDIHSSHLIYALLSEQKQKGAAVLYVGEDLDVLLELCDRILVLCGGKVSGIVDGRTVSKEQLGLLMTQLGGGEPTHG